MLVLFFNYFDNFVSFQIEPEVGSGNILVTGSVYSALDADESPKSPPITNNDVFSPAEISEHFGTITYQKAGSVIRMMHHLLGDEAFKFGLNAYLSAKLVFFFLILTVFLSELLPFEVVFMYEIDYLFD